MPPDQLFQVANTVALAGWLSLLAAPLAPRLADWIAGAAIPLVLALAYAILFAASLGKDGFPALDFSSLEGGVTLFSVPEAVLVGWLHFLAFDLFIGAWQVRTARAEAIPFLLLLPCLAFTFMLGPIGLLMFFALRQLMRGRRSAAA